jgi:hypothetical protein
MFGIGKNKKMNPESNNEPDIGRTADIYNDLRNQVLALKSSQILVDPGNEYPVYGAVIDMVFGDGDTLATMVCVLDGTVSLYYGNGGGIIGIGEKYQEVREEGFNLLANALQLLEYFDETDDFSLPNDANACFAFFLTDDGIYKAAFHMDRDDEGDVYNFLNHFVQNLLTSIRVNTEEG